MSKVVALDLGTKLGVAIGKLPQTITNVSEIDLAEITENGDRRDKLKAFSSVFLSIIDGNPEISTVIYEVPFCRGTHATRLLIGMAGLVEAITPPGIQVLEVRPTQVKKFATGSGKATKEQMIETANKFINRPMRVTDNEADAIHILRMGFAKRAIKK